MQTTYQIKRTTTAAQDFRFLVNQLDHELWNELHEDMNTYDQYNKVPDIETAILFYVNETPVACGCFKVHDASTVEIKRMFVQKEFRGSGFSKKVLSELETWAKEKGFQNLILETSIHFDVARSLYEKAGFYVIPNYPPYVNLPESVCMKKTLQ